MFKAMCVCVFILILKTGLQCDCLLFVVPEDVATGFAAIFGFAPPLHKGNDHRFGFGFRFGNHADLQILYEFGPQTDIKPLQASSKTRSVPHRQLTRRRPFIELLLKAGIVKKASTGYKYNLIDDDCDNEPR